MGAWRVVFYETASGRSAVEDYLRELPTDQANRVIRGLARLEQFGTGLGAPHVRQVRRELWELRITGRTQHRVLYVALTGQQILVLHAFAKKTQKTPSGEIETAERRLADYLERHQA